jgi:hypothetical protein
MKTLIESCFHLSTKLLKKDLRRARERKASITGFINISLGYAQTVADYYIEYGPEHDYLVISYGEVEQRVKLAESELRFGPRSWFICECDRRVSKLYLPPHAKLFKCRRCYKLSYELTTVNRKSRIGQLAYQTNRGIKLMHTRENMRSVHYRGKLTQRFNRFVALSAKAGITSTKEDALKLMRDLNG